ncbi:PIN domain-containing protein [Sporomusa acidovorans]|uniref:PIN domain-containing protein n=1 Tax=Sporomusa acidovorans (strain ATCC 49682 / DSM 3132 / Mol) TaxID=1123286 RepID=A0ABZ3IWD3_SPOA4|nr:PIN domain-containing protein [Sporomusa acidovorans]OZC13971.1 hypothetical protein SPACI_54030 [Sporomusa acidovorans DSM 3132]SDF21429.1 Predicted nucleic acid-binding protein, contains PIN domain [Sporomusa acidovorans]
MDVVVDANIIVEWLFFQDRYAGDIINLNKRAQLRILMSDQIRKDWSAGFCHGYKEIFDPNDPNSNNLLYRSVDGFTRILSYTYKVDITDNGKYSIDPGDDKYVQCAIEHGAEYIISCDGDHLNALHEKYKNCNGIKIKILSPYQFLNVFKLINSKFKISNFQR